MIRDPWIATTSRARASAVVQVASPKATAFPSENAPVSMSAKRVAGRKADLGQGERRKTFAADRPPEGLRRKGAPAPEAPGGEKGGGNLARRCRGRGRRRRPVPPDPVPWLSEAEAPARATPRPSRRSAPRSLRVRAPREGRPRPPRTRRRSARVPAAEATASPSPTKMASGNDRPTPIDRGHERADHRLAAKVRSEPVAPDRSAVVGFNPPGVQHLLRRRDARLKPRLPDLEETPRRVGADEIALGGQLSEESCGHDDQRPFGHLNCLSAGMLKGLISEDEVN